MDVDVQNVLELLKKRQSNLLKKQGKFMVINMIIAGRTMLMPLLKFALFALNMENFGKHQICTLMIKMDVNYAELKIVLINKKRQRNNLLKKQEKFMVINMIILKSIIKTVKQKFALFVRQNIHRHQNTGC